MVQALASFDPSFRIQKSNIWGSDPNAVPEMYIRGRSGIGVKGLDKDALSKSSLENNPNLPTFIMDGFEVSVQKVYDMDPNRVETINILKDAAATAMYGSRAANRCDRDHDESSETGRSDDFLQFDGIAFFAGFVRL